MRSVLEYSFSLFDPCRHDRSLEFSRPCLVNAPNAIACLHHPYIGSTKGFEHYSRSGSESFSFFEFAVGPFFAEPIAQGRDVTDRQELLQVPLVE